MIGAVGAIAGAIAITASLLYVAQQLKEATRQRRLESYRSVLGEVDRVTELIANDHGTSDIWWRASKGIENLTDTERVRYFAILYILFRSWERTFHYRSEGRLEDWNSDVVSKPMVDFVMSNGVQEYWALRRRWYTPDFRQWVDKQIKERSGVDIYGEEFRMFGSAEAHDSSATGPPY